MTETTPVIEIHDLRTLLGGNWVLNGIDLTVNQGDILGIVGGSGSGKTTLLRSTLLLEHPHSGSIEIFNTDLLKANLPTRLTLQQRWGVLFQRNALFSSLTVLDNIAFPLREHTQLSAYTIKELAFIKMLLAGLPADAAYKYPAEISGGMQKRAALARAIVLDPELLFLDEPTAGLDPDSAAAFDELILNLHATLGLTIVMVTHDLDSLWKITNRVAFLSNGKIIAVEPISTLVKNKDLRIHDFFNGPRGRIVNNLYQKQ